MLTQDYNIPRWDTGDLAMTADLIRKIQVEGLDLIVNAPANVDAMGRLMTLPNGGIAHGFTHDQPLVVL